MGKTIFSKILRGEIPAHKIYENEHVLAFLDVGPLSRGHTLVIPKEEVAQVDQLSDAAAAALGRALPRICRAVMQVSGSSEYNILQNNGAIAHQAVMHVHFHIIPKPNKEEGLELTWPSGNLDAGDKLAAEMVAALKADAPVKAERDKTKTASTANAPRKNAVTEIYTDGACSGNPGPGGWAWAIDGGSYQSGADEHTTNQRMELMAAFDAVRQNEGKIVIVSDSTYVVNCFKNRWYTGWLKRGWTNSKNQPVANKDIWAPFIELVLSRTDVQFRWVKGHSGHPMNDLVDQLAVDAGKRGSGDSGETPGR